MIGFELGLQQVRYSVPRIAVAAILLAAILTPGLLIWSIKVGQVDGMLNSLRSDPANREIVLTKDATLAPELIDTMRALEGIGYLVPTSRGLSVRAFVSRSGGAGVEAVSLLPSTNGDPLIDGSNAPALEEVIVPLALAETLGVGEGDAVRIRTNRAGSTVVFESPARITAVLPAGRLADTRLLVHPQIVQEIESYLEGYAIPRLGLEGNTRSAVQHPANARIYAADLEAVTPLERALSDLGLYARALNGNVERLVSLDHEATRLASIVGWMLALGGALALWAGIAINLASQRRHLALLRLIGVDNWNIVAYAATLGAGIGLAGTIMALSLSSAIIVVLNQYSPALSGVAHVAELPPIDAAIFSAGVMLLTVVVGLSSGHRLLSIRPSEVLRDENN